MRRSFFSGLLGLSLCCIGSCSDSSSDEPGETHSHAEGQTHADHASGETEPVTTNNGVTPSFCMDRGEFSADGIDVEGNMLSVAVVAADPEDAIADNNAWVLEVATANGPLIGAEEHITITPMMPDHGHGTPIVAVVTEQEEAGRYEISPVNLFMPGYWVVEVSVDMADVRDEVSLHVCVEQ